MLYHDLDVWYIYSLYFDNIRKDFGDISLEDRCVFERKPNPNHLIVLTLSKWLTTLACTQKTPKNKQTKPATILPWW